MSIKQFGGVFGRNPTFNDVTIEGTLTFDGDIDINSDLTVDGEVTADGVNISQLTGATLKIESTGAGLGAGSSIGKIDFFGNDASAPGAGVKASIETLTEASLGDDGALVFRTSSGTANNIETARLRAGVGLVLPSGNGIDFSATAGTGTSELLDDYEEGVFTVALAPSTSGTITINSSYQTLYYTKIGRVVYITGQIRVSAVSSPVGVVNITNLPFVNSSASQTPDTNFVTTQVIGAAADPQSYSGYIFANSSTIILYKNGNQTSAADFSGNEYISISGFYCAAT